MMAIAIVRPMYLCSLICIAMFVGRADSACAQAIEAIKDIDGPLEARSAAQTPAAVPTLISPGDLLDVSVFGEPDLGRQVRVAADGTADIIMVGNTHLAGMTALQAGDAIAQEFRARNLLLRPQVSVIIKESATQSVSVLGEVQHPGMYQITGTPTLLQVLSMAGGLTATADPKATVKHRNGQIESASLPLRETDTSFSIGDDPQVSPGDVIVIARAGVVYILGEVNRPGGFVMQNSGQITILELLSQAGGANRTASLDNSVLLRKTHIAFLIDRVVERHVRNGRDRHSYFVEVRITEHRVQRHGAAAAPAPDSNAGGINIREAAELTHARGLVGGRQQSNLPVDHFPPGTSF